MKFQIVNNSKTLIILRPYKERSIKVQMNPDGHGIIDSAIVPGFELEKLGIDKFLISKGLDLFSVDGKSVKAASPVTPPEEIVGDPKVKDPIVSKPPSSENKGSNKSDSSSNKESKKGSDKK